MDCLLFGLNWLVRLGSLGLFVGFVGDCFGLYCLLFVVVGCQ